MDEAAEDINEEHQESIHAHDVPVEHNETQHEEEKQETERDDDEEAVFNDEEILKDEEIYGKEISDQIHAIEEALAKLQASQQDEVPIE